MKKFWQNLLLSVYSHLVGEFGPGSVRKSAVIASRNIWHVKCAISQNSEKLPFRFVFFVLHSAFVQENLLQ
jgi:hypothetical protein